MTANTTSANFRTLDTNCLFSHGKKHLLNYYNDDWQFVSVPPLDLISRLDIPNDELNARGDYNLGPDGTGRAVVGADFEALVADLIEREGRKDQSTKKFALIRSFKITKHDDKKIIRIKEEMLKTSELINKFYEFPNGIGEVTNSSVKPRIRDWEVDSVVFHSSYGLFLLECKNSDTYCREGKMQIERDENIFSLLAQGTGCTQLPIHSAVITKAGACSASIAAPECDCYCVHREKREKSSSESIVTVIYFTHKEVTCSKSGCLGRFAIADLRLLETIAQHSTRRSEFDYNTQMEPLLYCVVALRCLAYTWKTMPPKLINSELLSGGAAATLAMTTLKSGALMPDAQQLNPQSDIFLTQEQLAICNGPKWQLIVAHVGTGKSVIVEEKAIQLELQRKHEIDSGMTSSPKVAIITSLNNALRLSEKFERLNLLDIDVYYAGSAATYEIAVEKRPTKNPHYICDLDTLNALLNSHHVLLDEFQELNPFQLDYLGGSKENYRWLFVGPRLVNWHGISRTTLYDKLLNNGFHEASLTVSLRSTANLTRSLVALFEPEELWDRKPKPTRCTKITGPEPIFRVAADESEAYSLFVSCVAEYRNNWGPLSSDDCWVLADDSSLRDRVKTYCSENSIDVKIINHLILDTTFHALPEVLSCECRSLFLIYKQYELYKGSNGSRKIQDRLLTMYRSRASFYCCVIKIGFPE